MDNSFGDLFRISTFGESHGKAIGVIIDGCPSGLCLTAEIIQAELDRRKPGQSKLTTSRKETDQVQIMSGVYEEKTLGTPIGLMIMNQDAKSSAYNDLKHLYRPSHADYTYDCRFGFRDWRGGGRASARETAARVAAGAVAKLLLENLIQTSTLAWVEKVHTIKAEIDMASVTSLMVERNPVRCPDEQNAKLMTDAIEKAKKENNSLGGIIRFKVENCPPGLGAPVFGKLTADIAKACMSIPATRSVSFGLGDQATDLTGHEHNDPFIITDEGEIGFSSNNAGGILGGISSGQTIYGTVSFKPTATISQEQDTVTQQKETIKFKAGGRHDPCVLPRAVPIVEAMINLVLADQPLKYSISNLERIKKIFC